MLDAARETYQRQNRIVTAGIRAARNARPGGSLKVARTVTALQVLIAREALSGLEAMLDEQNLTVEPQARVVPSSVAGTASDGRTLTGLFDQAATDRTFDLMVATQLQDTARAVASMGIAVRDQIGYVRQISPGACSRCAVLAGKWFKWNQGFSRHPGCHCVHVPARETNWHGVATNPDDYFHSLSKAEQDRVFTKAGAEAMRDGADMGQVVNARRGMQRAQLYGRDMFTTLEGTTRRGSAFDALARGGKTATVRTPEELAVRQTTTGPELRRVTRERTRAPRVMPETLYQLADGDRAEAIRLLKAHGFITT